MRSIVQLYNLFKLLSQKEEGYKALLSDNTILISQLEGKTSPLQSQMDKNDAIQLQLNDLTSFKVLATNEISL